MGSTFRLKGVTKDFKTSFIRLLSLCCGILLLLALGASCSSTDEESEEESEEIGEEETASPGGGSLSSYSTDAVLRMDRYRVNLGEQSTYLVLTIELQFFGYEIPEYVTQELPRVRHSVIEILTEKTEEQLRDPVGKDILKAEIKEAIRDVLRTRDLADVYFIQFAIETLGTKKRRRR